jgi:hypothetical protein
MLDPLSSSIREGATNRDFYESDVDESDVTIAVEALQSAPFRSRFIRTGCNVPDPTWNAANGQPIKDYVRHRLDVFNAELDTSTIRDLNSGLFQRYELETSLTVGRHRLQPPLVPTPRDLLHVYGADKDRTQDWRRFYRFAWTEEGPNAIIHSSDAQIINEGRLACNSYAYSGQSSFALAGTGMFFIPEFGDANVTVRPYVQWLTRASFTGTERAPATASAFLGIFVESWKRSGGGYVVDRDVPIHVWSQNTEGYQTNVNAAGTATVADNLATQFFAVSSRKYAIYVYAYIETSAAPQRGKNEQRFVTLDVDATVPFVVVEETLA